VVEKILIGELTHYYQKIGVAVVEFQERLSKGDRIEMEGKNNKIGADSNLNATKFMLI
jgi:hypothetical protein